MSISLDKHTIEQFRAATRKYSDASAFLHEAIARKAGLSPSDHKYLGIILQHEKLSAGEIAKLTGLTSGAITGIVDRLEKKKLVRRQFSRHDRRKVLIVPDIENSMRLLEPLFRTLQEHTERLILSFSRDELQIIERYFNEAVGIMKETTKQLNR